MTTGIKLIVWITGLYLLLFAVSYLFRGAPSGDAPDTSTAQAIPAALQPTAAELDQIARLKTGRYELIDKDELAQLRKDAEAGKNVGRYQVHQVNLETWRVDTSTGESCVLLAPPDWWKKYPALHAHSCTSQDAERR